jgi:hypothetical protein
MGENRFAALKATTPQTANELFEQAKKDREELYSFYKKISNNE